MSVSPKAKRKKEMTRKEVMEKLKQNENDISKAVQGLLEELCPFDVNDEDIHRLETNRPSIAANEISLPGLVKIFFSFCYSDH